jgi:ATP phosphoribosyltransferase regulatory subunit HisZ
MSMSTYSDDLGRVEAQLKMCAGIVEGCVSQLDAQQTEAQELIALVGQEDEDKLKALVQALAAISEAKAEARNTIKPIGEAEQVVKRYRDGL